MNDHFYALTDEGKIVHLGQYENMNEAMDNEPGNTLWTFRECDLKSMIEAGTKAIEEAHKS